MRLNLHSNNSNILSTTCCRNDGGFAALISVVLLATGVLAFSLATLESAVSYLDMVSRRELRIQAGLNLEACLDTAELMISRDSFMVGTRSLQEFGCTLLIGSGAGGDYTITASATLSGITVMGNRQFQMLN